MPIEVESPEQLRYSTITNNLSESSVSDRRLADLGLDLDLDSLLLCYGDHLGDPLLREAIAAQGEDLAAGDVTVTPGAAAALFCVATALLSPGDHGRAAGIGELGEAAENRSGAGAASPDRAGLRRRSRQYRSGGAAAGQPDHRGQVAGPVPGRPAGRAGR